MAGIYLHIPFCKQLCFYCDFHFSLISTRKTEVLEAMYTELVMRKAYLPEKKIETIYFGGGTPSILDADDFKRFFDLLSVHYDLSDLQECTLEANPDDLTHEYLKIIKNTPINRLSIGIQSFHDDDLTRMNRRHTADEGRTSVQRAQDAGFDNCSLDLIYGLPEMTMDKWDYNLEQFFALNLPHLSAYHLTYEPQTAFYDMRKKGKLKPVSEEQSLRQFDRIIERTQAAGYVHYEMSNYAKEGFFAQHNSAYWKNTPYLGIGPSAHSFDGKSRQWNIADNLVYTRKITDHKTFYEQEELSTTTRYNEYILTRLRTMWGVNGLYIKNKFGEDFYRFFSRSVVHFVDQGLLNWANETATLTHEGKYVADHISSELFYAEEDEE